MIIIKICWWILKKIPRMISHIPTPLIAYRTYSQTKTQQIRNKELEKNKEKEIKEHVEQYRKILTTLTAIKHEIFKSREIIFKNYRRIDTTQDILFDIPTNRNRNIIQTIILPNTELIQIWYTKRIEVMKQLGNIEQIRKEIEKEAEWYNKNFGEIHKKLTMIKILYEKGNPKLTPENRTFLTKPTLPKEIKSALEHLVKNIEPFLNYQDQQIRRLIVKELKTLKK